MYSPWYNFLPFTGIQIALFRDENGDAHAIDAYCPHLGANFAVGGKVKGDCIECPFHGWQFRGSDGKCTKIPYSENGKLDQKKEGLSILKYQVLQL